MIERLVDETLELTGVQVHRYQAVGAGGHEQVTDQPCGDRLPGQRLLILA